MRTFSFRFPRFCSSWKFFILLPSNPQTLRRVSVTNYVTVVFEAGSAVHSLKSREKVENHARKHPAPLGRANYIMHNYFYWMNIYLHLPPKLYDNNWFYSDRTTIICKKERTRTLYQYPSSLVCLHQYIDTRNDCWLESFRVCMGCVYAFPVNTPQSVAKSLYSSVIDSIFFLKESRSLKGDLCVRAFWRAACPRPRSTNDEAVCAGRRRLPHEAPLTSTPGVDGFRGQPERCCQGLWVHGSRTALGKGEGCRMSNHRYTVRLDASYVEEKQAWEKLKSLQRKTHLSFFAFWLKHLWE